MKRNLEGVRVRVWYEEKYKGVFQGDGTILGPDFGGSYTNLAMKQISWNYTTKQRVLVKLAKSKYGL